LGKNLSLSFGRQLHELSPIRSLGIQWIAYVVVRSPISIRVIYRTNESLGQVVIVAVQHLRQHQTGGDVGCRDVAV